MSLEGLKLGALYSYDCQRARMLRINGLLAKFIKTGEGQEKVAKALKKLVSYDWYCLIAKNSGIEDPFTEEVVKAYWLGNDLTKSISVKGKNLFLFHNFTVLTTPMQDSDFIDKCKSSFGRVLSVFNDKLTVSSDSLFCKNKKFFLQNREIEVKKGFLQWIQSGCWIGFHIGLGRKTLTNYEVLSLSKKTKQAIKLFNKQQK